MGWSSFRNPGMWLESSYHNQEPLLPSLLAQALF